MKRFRRLRNLIVFPLLALLVLAALALSLNKAGREDAPAPVAPAAGTAPDARAEADRAAAVARAEQAAADALAEAQRALAGIWAPAARGCAQGYGLAFTPDGRFAEGDEAAGVEGDWRIEGDTLIRRHRTTYELPDGELGADPLTARSGVTERLAIERLSDGALTLRLDGRRVRFVKCAAGQHQFLDGRRFGG